MPNTSNQNLKLIYLRQILLDETGDSHGLSASDLILKLKEKDISVTAQTLRRDIDGLRQAGMDIIMEAHGKNTTYHVGEREFSLAELKILSDCVQASKSISEKKSEELIKKLEGLANRYDSQQLHRQVYLAGRAKTSNEKILYNIDAIHSAISQQRPITFLYCSWNMKKKLEKKYKGKIYHVSPWSLVYDDDCYYLVAYDHEEGYVKHYRVDKMEKIDIIAGASRQGAQVFQDRDIAEYSKRHFGMFGGKDALVTLECENEMINVIIDRFGTELEIVPVDSRHFQVQVSVVISNLFYGWIIGLGTGVRIVGPEQVVEEMGKLIDRTRKVYDGEKRKAMIKS